MCCKFYSPLVFLVIKVSLVFKAKGVIFKAISWREQVTFWWDYDDDHDVHFALDQHAELGNCLSS
jgi:hypothetical protein